MNPSAYSALDHPKVSARIFHPRAEYPSRMPGANREDCLIPVDDHVRIGASFHPASPDDPVILFFHGNGEIASDYDDIGPMFTTMGVGFFVADYRGYGRSTGTPGVSAMMRDSRVILDYVKGLMKSRNATGPVLVMGRSLGSASALELAACRGDDITGLIVESGFADGLALLEKLGIDTAGAGITREQGFGNLDKIRKFSGPCLIIHAEYDHIIPFSDGRELYDACPSRQKQLLRIDGANHNDIFLRGMTEYLAAVRSICRMAHH